MVLPLSLLRTATGHPMLVELKNGETYNGHLVSCDNWMNICLREVICTSRDGDRFWKLPELVVRGNNIKYLRIPEEVRTRRRLARLCPPRALRLVFWGGGPAGWHAWQPRSLGVHRTCADYRHGARGGQLIIRQGQGQG